MAAKSVKSSRNKKTTSAKKRVALVQETPDAVPAPVTFSQSEVKPRQVVVSFPRYSKKQFAIAGIMLLLLALAAAPAYYFYDKYQKAQLQLSNPTKAAQLEAEDLVSRVSRHILLPTTEAPTIATVSDVSKLKGQQFFANAKNGDKVLIYSKAKKAVLYRPSEDKLIEVAPLQVGDQAANTTNQQGIQQQPSPAITQGPVKVAIYNGTTSVGLGGKVETELTDKMDNVTVENVENAAKKDYPRTLVIDVSGKAKDQIQTIARNINGAVTNLPNTEKNPKDVDILIIIGADRAQTTATPAPTSSVQEEEESTEPSVAPAE